VGALDTVEWEACLLEPVVDPAATRALRRELGFVPHGVTFFLDSPWMRRLPLLLRSVFMPLVHVRPAFAEMIALVVSQDNACRYCYAATRSFLRILGYPEDRIRRLEEGLLTIDFDARERLALDFARRVSRASPLATAADAGPLLEAGWSEAAVREIAFVTGVNIFYNRLATLAALPPEPVERMASSWQARLLRPLVVRMLKRRAAARSSPGSSSRGSGPFAAIVDAFDLPVCAPLRELVDAAWASEALARRAKALVFAVVARGLVSSAAEAEAIRLAVAEGLPAGAVAETLANLASPALDPLERALVPFARETIRYEPAQIQRRARALRAELSRGQFVELVGIAALANMLCRLDVARDLRAGRPRPG
jgi:alkylhydroperoxidase family enzyme